MGALYPHAIFLEKLNWEIPCVRGTLNDVLCPNLYNIRTMTILLLQQDD